MKTIKMFTLYVDDTNYSRVGLLFDYCKDERRGDVFLTIGFSLFKKDFIMDIQLRGYDDNWY